MTQHPAVEAASRQSPDPAAFVASHTTLSTPSAIPEVRLHLAHSGSGLWRLADEDGAAAPYWAFAWGGGLALARHILDHSETVAGKCVLDLGAGSGLVAIAAARAGASMVFAAEIDRYGIAAIALNAAANLVAVSVISTNLAMGEPPRADMILAGDVFYDAAVAELMLPFLDRCLAAGIEVLVGDPGRTPLPRHRLRLIATYDVGDFGEAKRPGHVFALQPASCGLCRLARGALRNAAVPDRRLTRPPNSSS